MDPINGRDYFVICVCGVTLQNSLHNKCLNRWDTRLLLLASHLNNGPMAYIVMKMGYNSAIPDPGGAYKLNWERKRMDLFAGRFFSELV